MKELRQIVNDIRRLRAMREGWKTIFTESEPGSDRVLASQMVQVLGDAIFARECDLKELKEDDDEYAR